MFMIDTYFIRARWSDARQQQFSNIGCMHAWKLLKIHANVCAKERKGRNGAKSDNAAGEGEATLFSSICYSATAVVSIVYDNSSLNNTALIRQFPFTQMTTIQVNLVC